MEDAHLVQRAVQHDVLDGCMRRTGCRRLAVWDDLVEQLVDRAAELLRRWVDDAESTGACSVHHRLRETDHHLGLALGQPLLRADDRDGLVSAQRGRHAVGTDCLLLPDLSRGQKTTSLCTHPGLGDDFIILQKFKVSTID